MKHLLSALFILVAGSAVAEISITDAFARVAHPGAKAGAAFFVIENTGDESDRLIAVASNVAMLSEVHTHIMNDDGVMQMRQIIGGIEIAAGESHALERGGDHVMMMGLTESLSQDAVIEITLTFEVAGEITIEVPVNNDR